MSVVGPELLPTEKRTRLVVITVLICCGRFHFHTWPNCPFPFLVVRVKICTNMYIGYICGLFEVVAFKGRFMEVYKG